MITPSTAALGISVAKGVIKLGRRLDALLAEKAAVRAQMVLVVPDIYNGPDAIQKVDELRAYLESPEGARPNGPLGADRDELVRELKKPAPNNAFIGKCYQRVFPERLSHATFSPRAAYVKELRRLLPGFDLSNEDNLAAAFSFGAGHDDRGLGYGARIGLLVADVVTEFGADHIGQFVRDPRISSAAQAVLERFSQPTLEDFTEWSPLARHALSATLNGLLDSRSALDGTSPWLASLLDVLAGAREKAGDEFIAGLLQGQGYGTLLSIGLSRAAAKLGDAPAESFNMLAADVLEKSAELAAQNPRFKDFFSEHWGDLLQAGLHSFERHGTALLKKQPEVVRNVLLASVEAFNQIPAAQRLDGATLGRVTEAALAAVVSSPGLLAEKLDGKPWLRAVLDSVVDTIERDGGTALTPEGLRGIMADAADVLARHPELLLKPAHAGVVRTVVGGVLRSVQDLSSLDAETLAGAVARHALEALAANRNLDPARIATVVTELTGRLGQTIQAGTFTSAQAAALADAAIEAMLRNPASYLSAQGGLATAALDALLSAAETNAGRLLSGAQRVVMAREVLATLARHGRQFEALTLQAATDRLKPILNDTLTTLAAEVGRGLDLRSLPYAVGGMMAARLADKPELGDRASAAYRSWLAALVDAAEARAAMAS